MALLAVIRREKMQALSTRVVIGLLIIMGAWAAAVLLGTFTLFYETGYWWMILIVGQPLADGLARGMIANARYCRPGWFKPESESAIDRSQH